MFHSIPVQLGESLWRGVVTLCACEEGGFGGTGPVQSRLITASSYDRVMKYKTKPLAKRTSRLSFVGDPCWAVVN